MTDPRYRRDYARMISSTLTSEEYATLDVDSREALCREIHKDIDYTFPVANPSAETLLSNQRIYNERHDALKNYKYALEAFEEAKLRLDDAELDYDINYHDFDEESDDA